MWSTKGLLVPPPQQLQQCRTRRFVRGSAPCRSRRRRHRSSGMSVLCDRCGAGWVASTGRETRARTRRSHLRLSTQPSRSRAPWALGAGAPSDCAARRWRGGSRLQRRTLSPCETAPGMPTRWPLLMPPLQQPPRPPRCAWRKTKIAFAAQPAAVNFASNPSSFSAQLPRGTPAGWACPALLHSPRDRSKRRQRRRCTRKVGGS